MKNTNTTPTQTKGHQMPFTLYEKMDLSAAGLIATLESGGRITKQDHRFLESYNKMKRAPKNERPKNPQPPPEPPSGEAGQRGFSGARDSGENL